MTADEKLITELRAALGKIFNQLEGIEGSELTRAEQNIYKIAHAAMKLTRILFVNDNDTTN